MQLDVNMNYSLLNFLLTIVVNIAMLQMDDLAVPYLISDGMFCLVGW